MTNHPATSTGLVPFNHRAAARDSLRGLAVGDAFGAQFFVPDNLPALREHRLPPTPWPWTDDTEMACSVFTALRNRGTVNQWELRGPEVSGQRPNRISVQRKRGSSGTTQQVLA
ncbi:ADP-ribosylglycohydrolase family protein, partial [Kitasatospora sp. MAP5-34]|uniref:ADP-ribosylglycohydrolase family protein n=1 Tax=Kitasatospora sp. MAP5-34 TaxID=3035102 RepID=UPI0024753453